jgi:putative acetyltransferase
LRISIRKEHSSDDQSIDEVTVAAFLEAPHTDHTEQLSLRNRYSLPDSLIGIASGLFLLLLLIATKGLPSHFNTGAAMLLIFTVPPAICSSIVNSYIARTLPRKSYPNKG